MGRCPVRSIFPEALEILGKVQDKVQYVVLSKYSSATLTVIGSCSITSALWPTLNSRTSTSTR